MFFTDATYWTAAYVAQREYWYRMQKDQRITDRTFVLRLAREEWNKSDDVWDMAIAYRVARNFPEKVRARAKELLGAAEVNSFDSFVAKVRDYARRIQRVDCPEKTRRFYAISGVSKILWHRYPLHGFIFDAQARRALSANGLGASFFDRLDTWGGAPDDSRSDEDFLAFAAAYQKFCLPLYEQTEANLDLEFIDPAFTTERRVCAIRVVDKLLWLAGKTNKRDEELRRFIQLASPKDRLNGAALAEAARARLSAA